MVNGRWDILEECEVVGGGIISERSGQEPGGYFIPLPQVSILALTSKARPKNNPRL